MHDVVPRGFDAYARVFHPATRERPVGTAWPAEGDSRAWEDFLAQQHQVDTERVTWHGTAAALGTVMHPLAQWQRIVRSDDPYGNGGAPRDDAGWRYDPPEQGALVAEPLATLASLLSDATTTPDAGCAAIWEGWGDLVGAMRMPAQTSALFGDVPGMPRRYSEEPPDGTPHRSFLYRSLKDVFNNPFRKPTWQPGILSDDISRGPRLELPNRSYVLFRGGVSTFADPTWARDAPWRDPAAEQHGFPPSAHAPNLVWPDDHAWAMVSEIDWDFTVVAGTARLVAAIIEDPRLEAASVPVDTDLSWESDKVNR